MINEGEETQLLVSSLFLANKANFMIYRCLHFLILLISTSAFSQIIPYRDVSTHFDGLGFPYGACGVPESMLDCPYFVALNVYDTPKDYTNYPSRPLKGNDLQKMGEYKNGVNCGRWVNVTIDSFCKDGINDGVPGHEICQGGTWLDDTFSGASLNMIVTDACGDGVVWCRDRRYHLDLSTNSLSEFTKNGVKVGSMLPDQFHNRMITWKYIKAPNYQGDIKIHWLKGAQQYWPCLMITHLENGIAAVEQKVNGNWIPTERNSDMGQSFILKDQNPPFIIRVIDADNQYVKNGREYTIIMPSECKSGCPGDATEIIYTIADTPTSIDIEPNSLGHIRLVSSESELIFKYSSTGIENKLTIYDLTGKIIEEKMIYDLEGTVVMPLLKPGFYIVLLSNSMGVEAHAKICL